MRKRDFLSKMGSTIAKLRTDSGLSLNEFGKKSGIGKSNLIPIEKGRKNITVLTLLKIAQALDVEVKNIFDFIEESQRDKNPPLTDQ